jgi:hypothetical protein
VLLPIVFASWAVMEPDGWVRDSTVVERVASPDIWMESRGFHPPDDPSNIFFAGHAAKDVIDVEQAIDEVVAKLGAQDATDVRRTPSFDRGREISELSWTTSKAHVHARIVGTTRELVLGACVGNGAPFAACEHRLAQLDLAPYITDDSRLRSILWGMLILISVALGAVVIVPRLLRRRDLRKSSPLVDGELVTIAGTVRPTGALLEAPLSGRACVYHRSHARLFASNAAHSTLAEPVELAAAPFVVDTPRGAVRVDERDFELALPPTMVVARNTPGQRAFIARHTELAGATGSFNEVVIEPGARVTLRGMVQLEHDGASIEERGYRDRAPTVARLVPAGAAPVKLLRTW